MTPDPTTKAQREALKRAWDILTEHFDRVLLVLDAEHEGEDGKPEDYHQGFWHGGSMSAIGLAEYAKDRLLDSKQRYYEPDDPDESEDSEAGV